MVKLKYVAPSAMALVFLLTVLGLALAKSSNNKPATDKTQTLAANTTATNDSSPTQTNNSTTQPPLTTNSSGLTYADGTPSQNQTSQPTESSTPQQGQQSLLDTSTYGQYDKYKDAPTALFADLRKGDGDTVVVGKKVAVLYKGWLTNGTLFDSNTDTSKPFIFEQGKHSVIAGWEQTIDGMKVGGVRFLVIPPAVGYGANGVPPTIPGNSVLIFQVELIAIQ